MDRSLRIRWNSDLTSDWYYKVWHRLYWQYCSGVAGRMRLQSGFHPEPDKNGEDVRKENLALKPGAQLRMLQHGSSCPQQPAPTAQLIQQPAPPTANMVQQTLAFQPAPTAQLIQQPAPPPDNMFQPPPTAPHFQTAHPAQQFQTAHPAQQFQMTPAAQHFQTTPMAHNLQQV
uniref:AP2/ERF domain-containing protein n=1 Tax=Globodera pallida TaxID=36090 RepID=A0A183CQJ8_GLOPA